MSLSKRKRAFCYWHTKCRDSKFWVCAAHLNEGHAFDCPYDSFEDSQTPPHYCVDAKIAKEKK